MHFKGTVEHKIHEEMAHLNGIKYFESMGIIAINQVAMLIKI